MIPGCTRNGCESSHRCTTCECVYYHAAKKKENPPSVNHFPRENMVGTIEMDDMDDMEVPCMDTLNIHTYVYIYICMCV